MNFCYELLQGKEMSAVSIKWLDDSNFEIQDPEGETKKANNLEMAGY